MNNLNISRPQILQKEFYYQYLATVLVNLTAFIFGIVIGFTGPNIELFKSDDTPLNGGKITTDEISWISALPSFGAIAFTLVFGYISEKFGRKKAILLIGIPQTISWVFMAIATDVQHIYVSRLLSGVAGAGVFFVVPVYIAEISDKQIRGGLCSSFSVICNIGIFVEFILADIMDFRNASLVILVISLIFVVGFAFMPESPQYLLSKKRYKSAETAFKFLRGLKESEEFPPHIKADFESIKALTMNNNSEKQSMTSIIQHLGKRGVLKGVFMAAVVAHFPILSGCFVLITYNQGIFKAAGVSVLSVFWSSLAFAFIQIIASLFTIGFVDKVGRKVILIGSAFSSGLCLAVFSAYLYVKTETSYDLSTASSWITLIPLVSLLVEVFVSSVGIIPVPSFYAPEILDQKVRNFAMSICSWWCWILGFLIIKFYPSIEMSTGLWPCMLLFAVTCCFCGFFTIFVLPETKGRNIEEIARSIEGDEKNGPKSTIKINNNRDDNL